MDHLSPVSQASITATPGAHSRACANCARAKAKCIANPGGAKCGRCLRLNKQCQVTVSIRKPRTAKKVGANNTARLEEKLDGLFSLLKSGAQSGVQAGTQPIIAQSSTQLFVDPLSFQLETPADSHSDNAEITSNDPYPSEEEANDLLDFFESGMLSYFPFMKMPSHESSLKFRTEHPFLFLCIIAVASRSTKQQKALGKEIRLTVGQKMLVESERTLDLLQGLLVYSGWAQTHIHKNPIVTNLLQLAIGLLGDLGLKKPPLKLAPTMLLSFDGRDCAKPFVLPTRTIEEQRIIVGVYWISSVYDTILAEYEIMLTVLGFYTHFRRIEPLRWTSYFDDCLHLLNATKDSPTDDFFVHQVRLQLLTEKALSLDSHDDLREARSPSLAPTGFYRKNLLAELQVIKRGIPLDMWQDETLLLQFYFAELSVHEIALSSTPPTSSAPNFERAEAFFACLRAAKDWFDVFLRLPPALWIGFSMSIFTQLSHAVVSVYKLSTFEAVGWDQRLTRDTIDYSTILGEIIQKMKQVKEATGLDAGISESLDVYNLASHKFQSIKDRWDAKIASEAAPIPAHDEAKDMYGDYPDDMWLKDILGMGWDEYQMDCLPTL